MICWTSKKIGLMALAFFLPLSFAGCGSMRLTSFDTLLKRPPTQQCKDIQLYVKESVPTDADGVPSSSDAASEHWRMDLEGFLKHEKGLRHDAGWVLDDFLDCTVGHVGHQAPDALKTYRGYVALAVLSRYAAFNYTGLVAGDANLDFRTYDGMHDDALATLARIDMADRMLRLSSGLATGTPAQGGNTTLEYMDALGRDPAMLPTVGKLQRALAVMLVATAAEKPTAARAKGWLEGIAEALAGGLLNGDDALHQGLKVLGKSLTLKTFGNAYLEDARRGLECRAPAYSASAENIAAPETNGGACPAAPIACVGAVGYTCPTVADWQYWGRLIKNSCDRIAASMGTSHHCLADWTLP